MTPELNWSSYCGLYQRGGCRTAIFRDMVLADARELGASRSLTFLDIGCGQGFDNDLRTQETLVAQAGRYIGIEPDEKIELNPRFHVVHRCLFEDAPIEPGSIDLAFSVMVLEHIVSAEVFWSKLHDILREGGVFWGFTVDSRSWFATASVLAKKLAIKDWYLDRLHGPTGQGRYENYPVFYRSNTPARITSLSREFQSTTILNFHRIGQLDYYLPTRLRWFGRMIDRVVLNLGLPGSVLAVRIEK